MRTADEQVIADIAECKTEIVKRGRGLIADADSQGLVHLARSLALLFPPIQRVADVSEPIEDLSDLSDEQLDRMRAIRDAARKAKGREAD